MTYIAPEESTFGVSFFERLGSSDKTFSVTQGPDLVDVLNSIKRNVSNVLNTRMGESLSSPELGLIDFNDATLESLDLSLKIKRAITHCLERYEPRLANVRVNVMRESISTLSLKFQIDAELNSKMLHRKVQLQLMLDQNKQYRVYS